MDTIQTVLNWMIVNEPNVRVLSTYIVTLTSIFALASAFIAFLFSAIYRKNLSNGWRILYVALTAFFLITTITVAGGAYYLWSERVSAMAETKLENIEHLIQIGDYDGALDELARLRKPEQGPRAEALRCEILVRKSLLREAILACSNALALSSNSEYELRSRYWLGQAKLLEGSATEAKEQFQIILDDLPDYLPALAGRCESNLRLRDYRRSLDDCTRVIRITNDEEGSPEADNVVARARSMRCAATFESNLEDRPLDRIEINQAIVSDCIRSVRNEPSSPSALTRACFAVVELARIGGKQKPNLDYCDLAEAALHSDPAFVRDRLFAVQCLGLRVRGQPDSALQRCSLVARSNGSPGFFVERELCAIYIGLREFAESLAHCSNAIDIDQRVADVWNSRCIANFWRVDFGAAAYDCNRALEIKDFALARKNLCRVLYWQGTFDKALDSCNEARRKGLGAVTMPEALAYACNSSIEIHALQNLASLIRECELAASMFLQRTQPNGGGFAQLGKCRALSLDPSRKTEAEASCTVGIQSIELCQAYNPATQGYDSWKDTCPSGTILTRILAHLYLERARLRQDRQAVTDAKEDVEAARMLGERDSWIKEQVLKYVPSGAASARSTLGVSKRAGSTSVNEGTSRQLNAPTLKGIAKPQSD